MAEKSDKPLRERGMDAAEAYLERQGLSVVETDYDTKYGKVHIVALTDDGTLVGVNVATTRKSSSVPPPPPPAQQRKIMARMAQYLFDHELELPYRYDLINILVIAEDRALLRHTKNWVVPQ